MHTVRQSYRHKHQVLVLQCYPNRQKNNAREVQPNPSELGYLLDYAIARPSKLQKVGSFLESRTVKDVARSRNGDARVTLHILTALIEKSPPDLPLYSDSVLKILETIVRSKEIDVVEDSLSTFETYCKHQNDLSLSLDQQRPTRLQGLIQHYVDLASLQSPESFKSRLGKTSTRWRTVGLNAITVVLRAEVLGIDDSKQLAVIVTALLEVLSADNDHGELLATFQKHALTNEADSARDAAEHPTSLFLSVRGETNGVNSTSDSSTAADSAQVEDGPRGLAIQCLRMIFADSAGGAGVWARLAAKTTLRFVTRKGVPVLGPENTTANSGGEGSWTNSLIESIARWTPVHSRFVIIDAVLELLVQSSVEQAKLHPQLTLATSIHWLLSSSIDVVDVDVVDILLGLLRCMLRLLPHAARNDTTEAAQSSKAEKEPIREELLSRLQQCIGSLATHNYYSAQISDMVTAILSRLKPSVDSDITSTVEMTTAGPGRVAKAAAKSSSTEAAFTQAAARITALQTVKNILLLANMGKSPAGSMVESRDRTGIQVWHDTQWLLREEDGEVRIAYADALLTWLQLETDESDRLLPKVGPRQTRSAYDRTENADLHPAKTRSTFLPLLHVAVYDVVHEPLGDADVALLHLILTRLTERLGLNAVRSCLPMICQLQDELRLGDSFQNIKARVNAESLVHGYLWALSQSFGSAPSRVGQEIQSEISQRKQCGLWLDKIRLPPSSVGEIFSSPDEESSVTEGAKSPVSNVSRAALVEEICRSYDEFITNTSVLPSWAEGRLAQSVKDELLREWSRDGTVAALEAARQEYLAGGKTTRDGRASVSPAASTRRRPTLKVAELKKALSGYQRGAGVRHSSPLRRPMSVAMTSIVTSMQSRSSSGRQSVVSFNEAGGDAAAGPDQMAAPSDIEPERYPTSTTTTTTTTSSSTSRLAKTENSLPESGTSNHHPHPRLGPDTPPPSISHSSNIPRHLRSPPPGLISSRDLSPVRPSGSSSRSRGVGGVGMGKPTSSRSSLQELALTPGPVPVSVPRRAQADLAALLAGISVDGNGDGGGDGGGRGSGRDELDAGTGLSVLKAPPY